jgi:serralysin
LATPTSTSPWIYTGASGDAALDALLSGVQWKYPTTLTFSFAGANSHWSTAVAAYGPSSGNGEPWAADYSWLSANDQAAVRDVLGRWSAVANLRFAEVTDSETVAGDLRFAYSYHPDTADAQAWAYWPGASAAAGDVWFNSRGSSATMEWTEGSHEHMTVTHEIGHALGLKHSFETGGPSTPGTIDPALDSRSYTVMSYSAQAGNSDTYFTYEPTTPMVLDILAMQHMYGANTATAAGNTKYSFNGWSFYHQTIWDGGGTDTIVYSSGGGGEIDLNAGVGGGSKLGVAVDIVDFNSQTVVSDVYNVYIAYGTVIENAVGGVGSDVIIGNRVANLLNGGEGDDTISGGAGNDTLNGAGGADSMNGGAGNDVYHVNGLSDKVRETGTASTEIDTVYSGSSWTLGANIERLTLTGSEVIDGTGNALANTMAGNDFANILTGGSGNDTLSGRGGNDTLYGGVGNDTYVVDATTDVVSDAGTASTEIDTVKASVTWALGARTEVLVLTGSAAIDGYGNALANSVTGNAAVNTLYAGSGNDTVDGGGGRDTLTGGAGNDCFRFTVAPGSTHRDRVLDFNSAADTFQLDDADFAGIGAPGTLRTAAFRSGPAAADASDRVIYDSATGSLYYDADGNGAGAALVFAIVTAGTALAVADFVIV